MGSQSREKQNVTHTQNMDKHAYAHVYKFINTRFEVILRGYTAFKFKNICAHNEDVLLKWLF